MEDRFTQHLKELDRQRIEALANARRDGIIEGLSLALLHDKLGLIATEDVLAEIARIKNPPYPL
jgi:hypothetical protein